MIQCPQGEEQELCLSRSFGAMPRMSASHRPQNRSSHSGTPTCTLDCDDDRLAQDDLKNRRTKNESVPTIHPKKLFVQTTKIYSGSNMQFPRPDQLPISIAEDEKSALNDWVRNTDDTSVVEDPVTMTDCSKTAKGLPGLIVVLLSG